MRQDACNTIGWCAPDAALRLAQYAVGLLLATLVVGHFTLIRIRPELESWGPLQEIRFYPFWVLGTIVLWCLPLHEKARRRFAGTARWLFLVIVLFSYMAASVLWTLDLSIACWEEENYLLMISLLLIAWHLVRLRPEYHIGLFLRLFFWVSVIFALGGLAGPSSWHEGARVAAFGGGPNVFVRMMGTGIIAVLYLWTRTGSWKWLLGLPLFFLGAVQSGSRGGLLSLLISVALAFHCLIRKRRRKAQLLAFAAALCGVLAFVPVGGFTIRDVLRYRLLQLTLTQGDLGGRDYLLRGAWEAFRQHPLCGIGLHQLHAHNFVLDFAAGGGIVALVLLAAGFGCLIVRWFRPRNPEQTTAFCCGILYLVSSLFSGYFYDTRFMWIFFLFYMMPATDDGTQRDAPFRAHRVPQGVTTAPA